MEEDLEELLKFDTLDAAEQTLLEVHARFSGFRSQGNHSGMERCRELILKVGGGGHGASPYLLKGVKYHAGEGFEGRESAGLRMRPT